MELLCPNCQKKLTVPEQYAGQLMRCPLCQGTFTVPALPSAVAAAEAEPFGSFSPPSPPKQDTYGVAVEPAHLSSAPLPPMSGENPSAAGVATSPPQPSAVSARTPPPPPPSGSYSHIRTLEINPNVVPWLAPIGLLLVFLLSFFTWKSDTGATAWSLAFGMKKDGVAVEHIHGLMIFFNLLTIFALILAIVSQLYTVKVIPPVPALKPLDPWRSLIVGALIALAWLFLTLQGLAWLFGDGFIPLNVLGILAWWIYTVGLVGIFLQFWLEQRGNKPLPRVSLEC
jgi:hypothetical protein